MRKRAGVQGAPVPIAKGQRTAVIYARVSSKDQEKEGYSIPAQLELLRGYAGNHGYDVLREFTDVETAKAAGRASFFRRAIISPKRKLLDFVLSNCTWKDGQLTAKYRQPFEVLAVAVASEQQQMAVGSAETGHFDNWLPEKVHYQQPLRAQSVDSK